MEQALAISSKSNIVMAFFDRVIQSLETFSLELSSKEPKNAKYFQQGFDVVSWCNVLIEECILSGLCAKACRIKCTNLEVTGCGFSGILSTYNSTILLKGTYQKKKI